MNTMMDRIRTARKQTGLSQADVARALHISVSAVNQWEQGLIKNIKLRHFFALANLLGQNPQWLATGKMFPLEQKPSTTSSVSHNPILTNEEKLLIHQVRRLDSASRKMLIKFLRTLDTTLDGLDRTNTRAEAPVEGSNTQPARSDDRATWMPAPTASRP